MAVLWSPQAGPQTALIDCNLPECFFGGARGGGKTDGVLGKWAIKDQRYGEAFNAMMFRRTTVSAEDAIERSKQIYGPLGGKFNASKLRWVMPNGGHVGFGYLDKIQDAQEWQGRNLTDAWIEEAGQFPNPKPIDRMQGVLRSAQGIPTQMVLTANPGGAGQHWVANRYKLFPFPERAFVIDRLLPNGHHFLVAVIPSRITDNKILLDSDPQYIDRLYQVGSEQLVKAWLEGDWSAVEGAYFDCWSTQKHVVPPFDIPSDWLRFRSMDWGYAAPFSVGWWAVAADDTPTARLSAEPAAGLDSGSLGENLVIPRGAMVRYREWYGADDKGEGLRLTAEEVAVGIRERDEKETFAYSVLDPAAFAHDSGPSIAERMAGAGVLFRRADNKRIATRGGAIGGWDQMRSRLKGTDGIPRMFFFNTCRDSIRTIPVLQHDLDKPEDLDTDQEDHAADEVRYACMSRPYTPAKRKEPRPPMSYTAESPNKILSNFTIKELIDMNARKQREI